MSILLQNRLLEAAEQKVESQLTDANRANYMRIVVAGMKVALAKGPGGILASLIGSKNPIGDCANGAVNLALLLRHQSRGTMPLQALVPAAMTLMLQALDFADKSGIAKIGNAELVQATHIFTNAIFHAFGITAPMLQAAAARAHEITQNPAQMEQVNRAAGLSKGPLVRRMLPHPGGAQAPGPQATQGAPAAVQTVP